MRVPARAPAMPEMAREPGLQPVLVCLATSRRWWIRAVRIICYVAVLVAAARAVAIAIFELGSSFRYQHDFVGVYVLIRAVAARSDPLLPIPDLSSRYLGVWTTLLPHPTPHPPTAGLIFAPFALLDYQTAAAAWMVLQVACLFLALYLLLRSLDARVPLSGVLGLGLICLAWPPVGSDLFWGNLSLIELAIVAGAWLATRLGHRRRAGVLLGLALLIKPITWPVILGFALRRDWPTVAAAVLTAGLGVAATGCVVGFSQLPAYVTRVLPEVTAIYRVDVGNISLASVAWRVFDGSTKATFLQSPWIESVPLIASPLVAAVTAIALPAAAIAFCMRAVRRWRSVEWSTGLLISLSVVANPIAWDHYEVLLLVPFLLIFSWLRDQRFPTRPTVTFAAVVALLATPAWAWDRLAHAIVGPGTPLPAVPALLLSAPAASIVALGAIVVYLGQQAEGSATYLAESSRLADPGLHPG